MSFLLGIRVPVLLPFLLIATACLGGSFAEETKTQLKRGDSSECEKGLRKCAKEYHKQLCSGHGLCCLDDRLNISDRNYMACKCNEGRTPPYCQSAKAYLGKRTIEMNDSKETSETVQQLLSAAENNLRNCTCNGLKCQCQLEEPTLKSIVTVTYNESAKTVSVFLEVNDRTFGTKTFSIDDPLDDCYDVKWLIFPEFCLNMYKFELNTQIFSGCAKVYVKFHGRKIDFKVGCFSMNLSRIQDIKITDRYIDRVGQMSEERTLSLTVLDKTACPVLNNDTTT